MRSYEKSNLGKPVLEQKQPSNNIGITSTVIIKDAIY
jgi:hypothetical protein